MRTFTYGWEGVAGIEQGLRESEETEKPVSFEIADHPTTGGSEVYERITVGIGTGTTGLQWRYCGERDDPSSAGSHMLSPTTDRNLAVAELAFRAGKIIGKLSAQGHRVCIFRMPHESSEFLPPT